MERSRALAARQIGFKADDTALLVVVHIHENPTKIIAANWKGKKYCHDAVIALAHAGESIFHPRGLYFPTIGAERHALFIHGYARFDRDDAVWGKRVLIRLD